MNLAIPCEILPMKGMGDKRRSSLIAMKRAMLAVKMIAVVTRGMGDDRMRVTRPNLADLTHVIPTKWRFLPRIYFTLMKPWYFDREMRSDALNYVKGCKEGLVHRVVRYN